MVDNKINPMYLGAMSWLVLKKKKKKKYGVWFVCCLVAASCLMSIGQVQYHIFHNRACSIREDVVQ